jgi:putative peptidoglycan lipid II flippase
MSGREGGRSAFVVGVGILISRLMGLVRNYVVTSAFGLSAVTDAYNTAFKIPNAVRNLLGEGTMSASFVPVYSGLLARGDERGARALANAMLGLLLAAVSVLTLIGIVSAPLLTRVFATGFEGETAALTTRLTRILFPMTGVMVLSGWCLGVQNAHRRFFWSYASAAMWSLVQIVVLLIGGPRASDAVQLVTWLAWATLGGALLQIAAQLPEVLRLAGPLRPTLDRTVTGVVQTLRNVVPVVTALGAVQVSSFIDLWIASYLPEGAVSSMTLANNIALLPVSLFGVSVAAASLPEFSRESGTHAIDALRERLRGGWQRILFYIVPSALAFIALGNYVVGMLYRGGAFTAADQRTVHIVLGAFAVGLGSFASVKLLASCHYALQDYRTPLRASLTSIVVSAITSVVLAYALRRTTYAAAGIALGTSLGSYTNLSILMRGLRERLGTIYTPAMWQGTRRIVLATLAATGVGLAAMVVQQRVVPALHTRVAGIPVLMAFGITYLVVAWWMGSAEAARWLRQRPRVRPAVGGVADAS